MVVRDSLAIRKTISRTTNIKERYLALLLDLIGGTLEHQLVSFTVDIKLSGTLLFGILDRGASTRVLDWNGVSPE